MIDLDKLTTYSKRQEIVAKKMKGHYDDVLSKSGEVTTQDYANHIDILDELVENMSNMIRIYHDAILSYQHGLGITQTAVHIYSLKFGTELVVPEGFIEFGEELKIKVDVVPEPGKITVTVEKQE